jgi:alkylhydroperoxidase family enzyme
VQAGPSADGWSERERILLAAVDQLHEKQDLDDELWTRLRSELDPAQVIEFLVLVGHYEMLATVLLTLRIEPDRPR